MKQQKTAFLSDFFQRDNQAFLSYDCEVALVTDQADRAESAAGDTFLLSMCMTRGGETPQLCGE